MNNPRQPFRPNDIASSANFSYAGDMQFGDPRWNVPTNIINPRTPYNQTPMNRPWNPQVHNNMPPTLTGYSVPPPNFNSPPSSTFSVPPPSIPNRSLCPPTTTGMPSPASLSHNITIPPPGFFPHAPQTGSSQRKDHNFAPQGMAALSQPVTSIPFQVMMGEQRFVPSYNNQPSVIHYSPPVPLRELTASATHSIQQVPLVKGPFSPQMFSQNMNMDGSGKGINADQLWVENWLSGLNKKSINKQRETDWTISKARPLFGEAFQALFELKANLEYLSNNNNTDEETWQLKLGKALKAKETLKSLLVRFTPRTIELVKKKMQKVKSKRARLKRQRSLSKEDQKLELQERERLHQAIDSWRNGIEAEILNKKKKEELKSEADNILSEVRRKILEAKKILDKLSLMEKLRAGRLDNAEKRGQRFSSETNERFDATVSKVRDLMTHQMEIYKAEEHALKVMLETEREQEKQDKQQHQQEALEACQNEALRRLFASPPDESSPSFVYWKYYMQGYTDLEALVQIRHHWDSYLSVQDDPLGSPVPLGWVIPKKPSSMQWEAVLAQSNQSETN